MKVSTIISVVNNCYTSQVDVVSFTPVELEKMQQFGEPLVETGGVFSGIVKRTPEDQGTQTDFELPSMPRRLKSDFPVKQVFSLDDWPAEADLRAKLYVDTLTLAMQTARNNVIALESPVVSEVIATL